MLAGARVLQKSAPVVVEVTNTEAATVVLHETFRVNFAHAILPRPYFNKHAVTQCELDSFSKRVVIVVRVTITR